MRRQGSMEQLLDDLPRLLPRAVAWAQEEEARALKQGVPLLPAEREIALRCGVQEPDRVRLLRVVEVPVSSEPELLAAAKLLGLASAAAHGMTLGYAVFVREEGWREPALVAHELVHVAQYERLGMEGFLRLWLTENLTVGYLDSPLELEALEVSRAALSASDSDSAPRQSNQPE